jgi:hypothetical protein
MDSANEKREQRLIQLKWLSPTPTQPFPPTFYEGESTPPPTHLLSYGESQPDIYTSEPVTYAYSLRNINPYPPTFK